MSTRRCVGADGSGAVTMIVLLFAATFGALVWLTVHADRTIADRSTAQSIAFQSARAGAQAVDEAELRMHGRLAVDPVEAAHRAQATNTALAAGYGVEARVTRVVVVGNAVTVAVSVSGTAGDVSATATVSATRVDGSRRE